MARVYLDSNIVIRVVEGEIPARESLAGRIAALSGAHGLCVVSDLVCMECFVKPFATGDAALRSAYEAYLATLDAVPLSRAVCVRAASIRARYLFETPDALHLAAAIEARCDVFVTGDRRLRSFPDIQVSFVAPDAQP